MADGKVISKGSYKELMETGALSKLVEECKTELAESNKEKSDKLEEYVSDDSDNVFDDDNSTVNNKLGTSALSTVSVIVARRRYSNITKKHHRTSTSKNVLTTEISNRQLTGTEKVETGKVKLIILSFFFKF